MRSPRFARLGKFGENRVQFTLDPLIRNTDHQQIAGGERPIPVSVVLLLIVVNRAIEFQHDPDCGAEEVGDEAVDELLPAEFPALQPPIPQSFPEDAFLWRHLAAELPGERQLAVRDVLPGCDRRAILGERWHVGHPR